MWEFTSRACIQMLSRKNGQHVRLSSTKLVLEISKIRCLGSHTGATASLECLDDEICSFLGWLIQGEETTPNMECSVCFQDYTTDEVNSPKILQYLDFGTHRSHPPFYSVALAVGSNFLVVVGSGNSFLGTLSCSIFFFSKKKQLTSQQRSGDETRGTV